MKLFQYIVAFVWLSLVAPITHTFAQAESLKSQCHVYSHDLKRHWHVVNGSACERLCWYLASKCAKKIGITNPGTTYYSHPTAAHIPKKGVVQVCKEDTSFARARCAEE